MHAMCGSVSREFQVRKKHIIREVRRYLWVEGGPKALMGGFTLLCAHADCIVQNESLSMDKSVEEVVHDTLYRIAENTCPGGEIIALTSHVLEQTLGSQVCDDKLIAQELIGVCRYFADSFMCHLREQGPYLAGYNMVQEFLSVILFDSWCFLTRASFNMLLR